MPTPNDVIAHALTASQMLLQRYTADLAPPEYLHRPAERANCAAWTIGHLTLTERRALMQFGVEPLPPLPDGFEHRFSREEGCPQAGEFGDVATLMPLFLAHRAALVEAVRRATPEQLDQPVQKPLPMFRTLGELANFMATHVAMHAGQITIIRRSLGRPPLV
jgi:hypothetical protein